MKRSDINQPPCYFDRYINYVDDVEIVDAFRQSLTEIESLDLDKLDEVGNAVYAEQKWTIKDIFQHLIDVEYILSYRALRFARNDDTQLSGFDEDVLAKNVDTNRRTLSSLVAELKAIRTATTSLFGSFDDVALLRTGIVSDKVMSPLAFGFTIVGHQKHHLKIIDKKYLPLITDHDQASLTPQ